jgi:hypothetical protein
MSKTDKIQCAILIIGATYMVVKFIINHLI